MKWKPGQRSGDVIDERGSGPSSGGGGGGGFPGLGGGGGGGMRLPGGKRGGILGLIIVVAVLIFGGTQLTGGDSSGSDGGFGDIFGSGLDGVQPSEQPSATPLDGAPANDRDFQFVSYVFDDVQRTWNTSFAKAGQDYEPSKLVVFSGSTRTGCGAASSATGPFYCPADRRVYIDLGFYRELARRFQAPGDFAQAYVIAHELGHHIQNLAGINARVQRESQADPGKANELSVRLELQADCLAGVWAQTVYQRGDLEPGDIEEGLTAASAVGDDRIQQATQGRISPETFTHGSSAQRQKWFKRGFDSGSAENCDTFSGDV